MDKVSLMNVILQKVAFYLNALGLKLITLSTQQKCHHLCLPRSIPFTKHKLLTYTFAPTSMCLMLAHVSWYWTFSLNNAVMKGEGESLCNKMRGYQVFGSDSNL